MKPMVKTSSCGLAFSQKSAIICNAKSVHTGKVAGSIPASPTIPFNDLATIYGQRDGSTEPFRLPFALEDGNDQS
jgi:hypothetical protein